MNGISHHYSEDTKDEDLVLGCQVFVDAAAALLGG
jgi:N-carbamoyl-L-amino-acid hydrolase